MVKFNGINGQDKLYKAVSEYQTILHFAVEREIAEMSVETIKTC